MKQHYEDGKGCVRKVVRGGRTRPVGSPGGRSSGTNRAAGLRQRRRRADRPGAGSPLRYRGPAGPRSPCRAHRRPLGEPIRRVMGIVNGTTNYILTRMTEEGASYHSALSEAQRLGYAERDPTADVEGYDAGAKAAIIAMVAFGVRVVAGDVYHEGISSITQTDIDVARRLGYRVKLLAIVERFDGDDRPVVAVRVHPAMVPETHPLAAVRDSFNAVFVEGGAAGDLMFYGRGAGGTPTASAVLGDLIDAANNLRRGVHASIGVLTRPRLRPI